MKREEKIKMVADGKAAFLNDGTVDQLNEVIRDVFHDNYLAVGVARKYYYSISRNIWSDDSLPENMIEISVKEIFEPKEPNWVMVANNVHCKDHKRILLHDLGEKFQYRYIVVTSGYEDDYIKGEGGLDHHCFKFMKPIPKEPTKKESMKSKLDDYFEKVQKVLDEYNSLKV